jgi:hypothetical protein
LVFFIRLGEDEAKRDLPLAEAVDEFEVELSAANGGYR